MTDVPKDFGAPNGTCISNKKTIFDEIDAALGRTSPPDFEYVLANACVNVDSLLTKIVRFGHSVVRYKLPDGTMKLMNICNTGVTKQRMVNFCDPEEYMFGTRHFDYEDELINNEQGGIYNREFISLRLEKVNPKAIIAIHKYFEALEATEDAGACDFVPIGGTTRKALLNLLPAE